MTGASFVRMTQESIKHSLQLVHPLHALKLADHAHMLRERVLESAAIHRPRKLDEWEAEHVAGWVMFKVGSKLCGDWLMTSNPSNNVNALAENVLDGEALIEMLAPTSMHAITGCSEEGIRTLSGLLGPADVQHTEVPAVVKALVALVQVSILPTYLPISVSHTPITMLTYNLL